MIARRAVAAFGVASALLAASCSSSHHQATGKHDSSPTTTPPQFPTVPDCGRGAYEPTTLVIACTSGDRAVRATRVTWQFWDKTVAVGTGTIAVLVQGRPTPRSATLVLSGVREGHDGAQFTQLTVTWIGPSPTGSPRAEYQLAPGT